MKKFSVIIVGVLFSTMLSAQVFNTGETLKPKTFSLGIEPAYYLDDFKLFLHGSYGIKKGIDVSMKLGLGGETYFGADVEWALAPRISLATGAHVLGDFGLDGTILFSLPVRKDARVFTGVDMDIVFADEVVVPVWIPLGVELGIKNNMSFILEGEIPIIDADPILGGGVVFYF